MNTPPTPSSPPSYQNPDRVRTNSASPVHTPHEHHQQPRHHKHNQTEVRSESFSAHDIEERNPQPHTFIDIGDVDAQANDEVEVGSAIPAYMRTDRGGSASMSRTSSNTSMTSAGAEMDIDISDRLSEAEEGESTPLLHASSSSPSNSNDHSYGTGDDSSISNGSVHGGGGGSGSGRTKWWKGPLVIAAVKFSLLFIVFTAIVVVTFYTCLPKMDSADKSVLKLPRSFADLQALNSLFQKYKSRYPLRLLACGVVTYLFVQMFTLPGSMYISILFGAAYGIGYGLLLSCLCDAFGSLLCYTLSSVLAPPLLALPFYRARVETWRIKIMGDPKKGKEVTWDGVFAFLIVLRIAPFPPHWIANFVAPHLDISPYLFWASCFIGIAPVSVIHVTIGSSLDSMTSAADFHILSLRNILGLCAVVVAVLIPVGLKRVFKKDLGDLGEAEEVLGDTSTSEREIDVPPIGEGNVMGRRYHAIDSGVVLSLPSTGRGDGLGGAKIIKGKGRALEIIHDLDEEDEEDYEDEAEASFTSLSAAIADATEEGDGEGEGSSTPSPISGESSTSTTSTSSSFMPAVDQDSSSNNNATADNIIEPTETTEDPQWQYEVYDPQGVLQHVEVRPKLSSRTSKARSETLGTSSRPKSYRTNTNASRGYGAIERDAGAAAASSPLEGGKQRGWWPFGKSSVA